MPLNIKDPETDRLARALASETGETITVAARIALEERLGRVRARKLTSNGSRLRQIIERGRSRAILDDRPDTEILGYDASGMPD